MSAVYASTINALHSSRIHLRSGDILFFMVLVYLVVDSINGAFIRYGYPSISMPYKIMLLTLVMVSCRSYLLVVFSVAVILTYVSLHFLAQGDFSQAVSGADWLMKFLSIPVFLVYFHQLLQSNLTPNRVFLLARFCFVVLAFNILLGSLGIGFSAYSDAESVLGAKGFIFAGNELGLALVVSGGLVMQQLLQRNQLAIYMAFSSIFILFAAMSAVKTALVGALLLFFLFPLVALLTRMRGPFVPLRVLVFCFVVILLSPLVIFTAVYFVLFVVGLWDRILYFLDSQTIWMVVFSGRIARADVAIDIFARDYTVLEQLMGRGTNWMTDYRVNANVEIDFFDFLMRYGLVGVSCSYAFLFTVLFLSFAAYRQNKNTLYGILLQVIIIATSLTAGHVLYSGTAAPLVGAVLATSMFRLRHRQQRRLA